MTASLFGPAAQLARPKEPKVGRFPLHASIVSERGRLRALGRWDSGGAWPEDCILPPSSQAEPRAGKPGQAAFREGVRTMDPNGRSPVETLVERVDSLREPYRRNAILWLEHCTRQPLPNFQQDLHQFMEGLTPSVREEFVIQTKMVLEDAVRYFGGVG